MHVEQVEIYSDETNAAVLRHPGRRFPGILIQGDTLYALCLSADEACIGSKTHLDPKQYEKVNALRNSLWSFLAHYRAVLDEHNIPLPFVEVPISPADRVA